MPVNGINDNVISVSIVGVAFLNMEGLNSHYARHYSFTLPRHIPTPQTLNLQLHVIIEFVSKLTVCIITG